MNIFLILFLCRGGQLQGNCSEGYFCLSQSYDYTPDGLLPDVDNFDEAQCPPNTTCAGPCPPGHYCPAGIVDPVPCKNNTWRPDEFGSRVEDCEPCPAGEQCLEGKCVFSIVEIHLLKYSRLIIAINGTLLGP